MHPLKELVVLLSGVIALLLACILVLGWMAESFADRIPFETETELVSGLGERIPGAEQTLSEDGRRIEKNLQALADRIAATMDLPEGMNIRIHYSEQDVVNAFAFLGGHIVMYRGLIQRMQSENELAMVLAHEIAHVRNRHVIRNLGRSVVIGVFLSMVMGSTESDATDILAGSTFALSELSFSRDQERQADEDAAHALIAVYGHISGGAQMFQVLMQAAADQPQPPAFMSTHPLSQERIDNLETLAAAQGWTRQGDLLSIDVYRDSTVDTKTDSTH